MAVLASWDRIKQVDAAGKGDRQAAAALIDELLPRMRRLVGLMVRNNSDIEDFAQDAAVAVLRSLSGYRGDGVFERWVDTVVKRAIFGSRRRNRADRLLVLVDGTDNVIDRAVSVQQDEYLSKRRALGLLNLLSPEQQQVVVCRHLLEMSVLEISTELDIPFETVRSRLRLAKQRLRLVDAGPPSRATGASVARRVP